MKKFVSIPINGRAIVMSMEEAIELYEALRRLFETMKKEKE